MIDARSAVPLELRSNSAAAAWRRLEAAGRRKKLESLTRSAQECVSLHVSLPALIPADCQLTPRPNGGRTYRLHVAANVPVNNFWSVIAYDSQTRSFLQTDQTWPSVTSKDKDVSVNDDGSVDAYFGPERPEGARNHIQTLPAKGWNAIFRLYGPLEPWFDKTWRLSEVECLD